MEECSLSIAATTDHYAMIIIIGRERFRLCT